MADETARAAAAPLVVGVGASKGVPATEVLALIGAALADAGLDPRAVVELATVRGKAHEPGLVGAATALGVPLVGYAAGELAAVEVPHGSGVVLAAVGTPSVAEAAALAGGGQLLVPKRKSSPADRAAMATCAIVRRPRLRPIAEGGDGPPTRSEEAMPIPTTEAPHDLRHHGDAEVRDDGGALIDLAVNVRTDTPPAWLRERIADSLTGLAAYPDGRSASAAVAARHGLPAERVLLTAGAAEAFVLLARGLTFRHPVVVHPQFTGPEAALRDAGHEVRRVLLRAEDGFRLDPAAVPEEADLVVVGNPTNPTSVLHPADTLAQLARPGRTLVVDEAFMDAVPGEREALAGRTDLPGLVVLRSLTKTWGLAGLRIGYVLAEPETLAALQRAQPLWPVSTPALVAAGACMEPRALAEAAEAAVRVAADRAHLLAGLAEFEEVRAVEPAEGPFVLIRIDGATQVRERLRTLGFAARRGDTFPGLGADWLRLAVRDRPTTNRFLQALDQALTLTHP
ncbi:Rv2231c family pyridoxal phosphate-dependent protein CobC [Streptomyces sp. SID1034]|uniref:Rv2231c family pyridoxal phosphate-dependent protein CobC n=1 Tax=Streptomyces sp. SID1034 TaxID=2690248 RepID=UPI0013709EDD|nr:Rv2231c family pyridoxal phosphate-dependent protein CobC [Streptomyces sp. SID1034]MYV93057.1 threonine-phosphate decarboxylase [Streptomyces sp. SID1034]